MANCNLTIELDEPRKPRTGGEAVSGSVIVTATGPVHCKGLEATTYWSTHGRGNIDLGDIDQQELYQGQWEANREYRYPFQLKSAAWPPTYYGTMLNVSQAVRVRAKVPWSKDPTATAEYPVVAFSAPEDLKPSVSINKKPHSILGWLIGGVLIIVLLAFLSVALLFLVIPLAIGAVGYWFVRVFLPRQVTGSIECKIEPQRVKAGDTIRGQLRFTPKRNMKINAIRWTVTCGEKCSSGSGSDRKTHLHEVLRREQPLSAAGELRVGEPQAFDFSFTVPPDAAPSLKFSNNELNWVGELRIDIAQWPDWVHTVPLTVTASPDSPTTLQGLGEASAAASPEEEWFFEVLRQVERCQNDRANRQTVLDAVRGQQFAIRVDIDEELGEPPPSFPGEFGVWRIASTALSEIEVALVWKPPNEAPGIDTEDWCGTAEILGFDENIDCLVMRVIRDSRR